MNELQIKIQSLQKEIDNMKRSNSYDIDMESALRERLGFQYIPTIFIGSAAPATTPLKVGDVFCDTTNAKSYMALGTSSSTDWKILN